jgi:hypothetical protein
VGVAAAGLGFGGGVRDGPQRTAPLAFVLLADDRGGEGGRHGRRRSPGRPSRVGTCASTLVTGILFVALLTVWKEPAAPKLAHVGS